jgi:hypothetical protein
VASSCKPSIKKAEMLLMEANMAVRLAASRTAGGSARRGGRVRY